MRIPISLPCQVPVVPGTPDIDAPIEDRTERCAVDAWWMVGKATICTHHLRATFGEATLQELCGQDPAVTLNPRELVPWQEMYRYQQHEAVPDWDSRGRPGTTKEH
jgi:hypothetical protein